MGFLVGNDFIPHLPHFHINKGALPLLYSAYMDILPTMDGYLNENGLLNLPRFEKFMERLAQIDYDHFNDVYADTKWLESRHGRKRLVEHEFDDAGPGAQPPRRNTDTTNFLLAKSAEIDDLLGAGEEEVDDDISPTDEEDDDSYDESDMDEDKQFQAEFKAHKRHYYMDKLDYSEVDGYYFISNYKIDWIVTLFLTVRFFEIKRKDTFVQFSGSCTTIIVGSALGLGSIRTITLLTYRISEISPILT